MDERILIVSSSDKSGNTLADILRRYTWNKLTIVGSGAEARREAPRGRYALIIINSPLGDEQGSALATDLVNATRSSVILIARSDAAEVLAARIAGEGVFVIPKPLQQRQFLGAVRLALAVSARMYRIDAEIAKQEKRYEELRTVSRAKCMLIEKEHMTEQEAHRFIEKQAMDNRESRAVIAAGIITKLRCPPSQ